MFGEEGEGESCFSFIWNNGVQMWLAHWSHLPARGQLVFFVIVSLDVRHLFTKKLG